MNSTFGVPALNLGVVATSTNITSSSVDSRFWPRKEISFPSARQCSIANTPSAEHQFLIAASQAIDAKDKDALLNVVDAIDRACENCLVKYWYPKK